MVYGDAKGLSSMPMPIKNVPHAPCRNCGTSMHRVRFTSGRLEDATAFKRRQFCTAKCMGEYRRVTPTTRSQLVRQARRLVSLKQCNRCGATSRIGVHHRDGNWANNDLANLEPLCVPCHSRHHHTVGYNRKPWKICKLCSTRARVRGLCQMHATRLRKWGSPFLIKTPAGMREVRESIRANRHKTT